MTTQISITNQTRDTTIIDIEGVIGVPEEYQFEKSDTKTATYEKFRTQLAKLADISTAKVIVNIRSTGGDVGDALLIHDALCGLKAQTTTRCYGYVASAATIIAQAAGAGRREISSNALYLIHKSACATEGNSTELTRTMNILDKTDGRIAEIYAERSGKDISQFLALMEENNGKGRWLSPKETLEAGLADRIIKSSPKTSNAIQLITQLGLPPVPNISNSNQPVISIAKRFRAILGVLGLAPADDNRLTEKELDVIEQELVIKDKTISSLANEQAQIQARYTAQVEELQSKVAILEAQNAKFRAAATRTKAKEDPSYGDYRMSPNEEAYKSDIKNFR